MSGIFPFYEENVAEGKRAVGSDDPSILMEYAWDFEKNEFVLRDGKPVLVTGDEALLVWAYKALRTERFRYLAYSWNFGSEFERLIGDSYSVGARAAEAERYVREALLVHPYIKDVADVAVDLADGELRIAFRLITVFGEVNGYV